MARTGLCQETDALLQGLADGVLSADERATLEAHLAECPACTAEAVRLRDNALFLQETLGPLRLAPDYATEFLFQLPRKDPKRRAAPAPAAASKTMVLGETRPRRGHPLLVVGGLVLLGGGGLLAWQLTGSGETVQRPDRQRPPPEVKPRPDKGDGPADPKKAGPTTPKPGPAGGTPLRQGDLPGGPIRNAAGLIAALREVRGEAFGPVVGRGWDFLAGTPAEAKAVREAASKEKDHRIRAALVLCLGADGGEEARAATREFLADGDADVRAAAALALARSLSYESPAKKPVPSGPPLGIQVLIGVLADDPRRAELAGRLAAESDPGVRRTLFQVLGPSAGADPSIRDRLLDGLKGLYGDDQRETALRAFQGLQDPALVEPFFEVLVSPATPKALQAGLFDGMVKADARAASEKFGEVLKSESVELRRLVVAACPGAGTPAAQKALVDALGSDQDAGVRVAVVLALQRFPAKEVLEAVHRAADNDTDLGVRQEAERVHKILKATLDKAEGPQDNPPADNPPAPAPAPAPADGN